MKDKKSARVRRKERDAMHRNELLHVEDLTMAYRETAVIWDIDLSVPEGVRCAIVGPNGAGKSTLLKGILGLEVPVSGFVRFWGKPLDEVRRRIAYVPQRGAVNWDFPTTVSDVVLMGATPTSVFSAVPKAPTGRSHGKPWRR